MCVFKISDVQNTFENLLYSQYLFCLEWLEVLGSMKRIWAKKAESEKGGPITSEVQITYFFFIYNCLLIKIKLTINFSLQPKLAFWSRTKYHEITNLFFITYLFWRDFELNVISKWNRMIYITLFSSHKSQRKIVKMCIIIFTWYLNIFDPGAWGWNGVLYL